MLIWTALKVPQKLHMHCMYAPHTLALHGSCNFHASRCYNDTQPLTRWYAIITCARGVVLVCCICGVLAGEQYWMILTVS